MFRDLVSQTLLVGALVGFAPNAAQAADSDVPSRQAVEDAWWTGPILAASASTLPQGHFLIEPYLYDSISYARFDAEGDRHATSDTHFLGSQTYLLYGLFDRVSVGLIPRFGFRDVAQGRDSSGVRVGDLSLQGQYRLTSFDGRIPTTSIVLQATLPTGKHDRLGAHTSDAMGSGAYSMTLALYSQYLFWLPNGRILRARFNVAETFSDNAALEDVSVYGTQTGFRGRAQPGNSFVAIAAGEYSLSRHWVLALDAQYQHDSRTSLDGWMTTSAPPTPIRRSFPSRSAVSLAPAVEYNINANVGVIVGAIWTVDGRNTDASIIPVAAVNIVY